MQDMKTIKVQLHLVLADEGSITIGCLCKSIRYGDKPLIFGSFENSYPQECKIHHLYFTSDEEIKDGDTVLGFDNTGRTVVGRVNERYADGYIVSTGPKSSVYMSVTKGKIVASTDPKLLSKYGELMKLDKHGSRRFENGGELPSDYKLPQPSKQLVEAYCKKPFDECLIEVEQYDIEYSKMSHIKDKATRQAMMTTAIPINMKVRVKVNTYNEITCHPVVEKMYTEKELMGAMEYAFMTAKDMSDCEYYRKELM